MRNKRNAPVIGGTIRESKGWCCNHLHCTARAARKSSLVAGATFLLAQVFILSPAPALADGGTWEPETVWMEVMGPSAQPAPIPAPGPLPVEVDEADAEILAKLLWSSPLTNETRKRELCWLVFNRVDDERLGVFGASVESVVIRREFSFYDPRAHVSETNLRIAREELRRWELYLIGAVKERMLPAEYVYAAFEGHGVRFYAEIGGEPWQG